MSGEGQLVPGTIFAEKYRIERLLGEGGMGAVYAAVNTWTEAVVAVKVLHPQYATSAEASARFLREGRAASRLKHPNIVQVLDMGIDSNSKAMFLVQEFLRGQTLSQLLEQRGRLSPHEAFELLSPVMEALAFAHERGVVHRDLKPDNIFLDRLPNGTTVPKLIDFGISKIIDNNDSGLKTRTGAMMGTPYYMAPEQARGDREVDSRADVWSMGVVLFEALSGKRPFDAPTFSLLLVKLLSEPAPSLQAVAPELPASIVAVIDHSLQRNIDHRIASMSALRSDLQEALQNNASPVLSPPASNPVVSLSPPLLGGDTKPSAQLPVVSQLGTPQTTHTPSRLALLFLGGFSLLLLAGLAFFRNNPTTPPPVVSSPQPLPVSHTAASHTETDAAVAAPDVSVAVVPVAPVVVVPGAIPPPTRVVRSRANNTAPVINVRSPHTTATTQASGANGSPVLEVP